MASTLKIIDLSLVGNNGDFAELDKVQGRLNALAFFHNKLSLCKGDLGHGIKQSVKLSFGNVVGSKTRNRYLFT
jgi:hypothetical protein